MKPVLRTASYYLPLLWLSVANLNCIVCYSQIALSGSGSSNEGPKIYKAMNVDLIFPKTFNSSENVISTTAQTPTITLASSRPSAQQPAIYVTPAIEDEVMVTTSSPRATIVGTAKNRVTESYAYLSNEQQQAQDMQPKQQQKPPAQQQQINYASTGRAVDYRPTYPFGQLITPLIHKAQPRPAAPHAYAGRQQLRPLVAQQQTQSGISKIVYPNGYSNGGYKQQQQRAPPKAQISDRFSPSEGVVSHQFKNQQHNHQHYHSASPSNQVSSYVPPKDIYSFPPNINAKYPSPAQDPTAAVPTSSVSSYLPPASGPLSNGGGYPAASQGGYVYPGPISPDDSKKPANDEAKGAAENNDDDTIGVLPASAMDTADAGGMDADASDDMGGDSMDMGSDDHAHDHDHDHHSLSGYDTGKEYPTPPPGWLEEHPDAAQAAPTHDNNPEPEPEHDHHHHHEHIAYEDHHHDDFLSYPIYKHAYPEIIYDDHYHHHHPPPTLPPETTVAPPPEPPPEPRVKKYSYFYIGRKLWYIPLYFTVWFSFYVLWLIVKSIARHKVNLPNHYVSRRSLPDNSAEPTNEYLNELTVKVLEHIDKFQKQYLVD